MNSTFCLESKAVYSTSGKRDLPPPRPDVIELLVAPAPREREGYIEYMVKLYEAMAGKGFAFDQRWTRGITGNFRHPTVLLFRRAFATCRAFPVFLFQA